MTDRRNFLHSYVDVRQRVAPIWHAALAHSKSAWEWSEPRLQRIRQWSLPGFRRAWQWLKPRGLAIFVSTIIGIFILVLVFSGKLSEFWHWYSRGDNSGVTHHPNADLLNPIGVAIGGALAAWAVLRQARNSTSQAATAAESLRRQSEAERKRRITESFSKAVDQLASDKIESRLGGIYALERISKESPDDYWTMMETLTAFVRERTRRTEADHPFEERVKQAAYFLWENAGKPEGRDKEFWAEAFKRDTPAADIAAVLTVIDRRSEEDRDRERDKGWRLDFHEAVLRNADFEKMYLVGAKFVQAHLDGADLTEAHLDHADLTEAHLDHAGLTEAHLEGAHLTEAHLQGASLTEAHLEGAFLRDAHLEGPRLYFGEGATLWGTHLQGAFLRDAHLEGAYLKGAHLEGAYLKGAHLEGADLRGLPGQEAATGLTTEQLKDAYGDAETRLPAGVERPEGWPPEAPEQ